MAEWQWSTATEWWKPGITAMHLERKYMVLKINKNMTYSNADMDDAAVTALLADEKM